MEEATEAERCLKIKVDKLQECLEELIDEMETASPRRTSSLGLDSPSRQSSLMQDSKGNPLPAAAQLQIASLNTQLYQKDLQIQALQGRLASYEAGSLLSPTQTLSLPNSSFSAVGSKKKATDLAGTTLSRSSTGSRKPAVPPCARSASTSSRKSRLNEQNADRVRQSVERTISRVYVVLKQVDDAEKRLRGKKDTATASAHEALSTEQRTLVSALAELEGGTRKGSLAEEETKTSKRRKTAEGSRGVSPRVRKPQKAPVPPISIAELRLKTPRPASPKFTSVAKSPKQASKTYRMPGSARRSHPGTPTTSRKLDPGFIGRLNNA